MGDRVLASSQKRVAIADGHEPRLDFVTHPADEFPSRTQPALAGTRPAPIQHPRRSVMPFADVNGQSIHYLDTGGDGPAILLSHGFSRLKPLKPLGLPRKTQALS